jgi:dGTPase
MKPHGGFEHNLQSLRVVDVLEERYARFDGLNLCFETREGLLKRCPLVVARWIDRHEPGGIGARFLARQQPSLEAQLTNLADEIAYNAHDVDDGVRSGLISFKQVCRVPLIARFRDDALAEHPELADMKGRRLLFETLRRMLSAQVYDVIAATQARLGEHRPANVDDVRAAPPIVEFSAAMRRDSAELKRFLFRKLYRHARVSATTVLARQVVADLFAAYTADPSLLPTDYREAPEIYRAVADYIAGMTDRFALREHERISGGRIFDTATL